MLFLYPIQNRKNSRILLGYKFDSYQLSSRYRVISSFFKIRFLFGTWFQKENDQLQAISLTLSTESIYFPAPSSSGNQIMNKFSYNSNAIKWKMRQ